MARTKRGRAAQAARYRNIADGGGGGRPGQADITSHFLPRAVVTHGFSLADEARNTANNHSASDSAGQLRGRPVTFVCAGVVEPLKELEELGAAPEAHDHVVDDRPVLGLDGTVDESTNEVSPPFFIDTAGDQSLAMKQDHPARVPSPRARSPSSSGNSSDDVVLFRGRKGARQMEPRQAVVDEVKTQVQVVEQTMQHISLAPAAETSHRDPSPSSPKPWMLRGHHDDDDIVADYIANMANDDEDGDEDGTVPYNTFFSIRDLGGPDRDFVPAEDSDIDASPAEDGGGDDDDSSGVHDAEESAPAGAHDIDDATLARLLAKQEELGLSDDDLALYSANTYGGMRSSGNRENQSLAGSGKGKKNARGQIPSASAVADAFDDLDLVDWDRHNPPRRPKNKRGQPTFDISDSELEATVQAAFQKDRLRKKERKKEREELRAQGLLGKNANPDDLRVKYPTGMTMDQIKEEMRAFLQGTDQLLTFPPMDSHARKTVHELSLRFNVKSKSTGNGEQRRPVLHRTKRTVKYRHVHFEEVFSRQQGRKYFHRMDKNRPSRGGAGGGRSRGGGGGVNHAAFTYKEGEVVGGGAPELGQNNKGRTLLEKMGWSTGMALGATDNKGILQPVAHVVKRTKAGLG